jgi:hypothetical protein
MRWRSEGMFLGRKSHLRLSDFARGTASARFILRWLHTAAIPQAVTPASTRLGFGTELDCQLTELMSCRISRFRYVNYYGLCRACWDSRPRP